jgi:hypothetical protein
VQRFTLSSTFTTVVTTDDTCLQIRPAANLPVFLERIVIMGKGVTAGDEPVEFRLLRQTGDGSGGSAVTPRKIDLETAASLQVTAQAGNFSTEPTDGGDFAFSFLVHPASRYELVFPFNREFKTAAQLGIVCIQPAQANLFHFQVEGFE